MVMLLMDSIPIRLQVIWELSQTKDSNAGGSVDGQMMMDRLVSIGLRTYGVSPMPLLVSWKFFGTSRRLYQYRSC